MTNEQPMIYKLSSGEEIIGKYVRTCGDVIQLRSPLRIERMAANQQVYYTLRTWLIAQFDECEERIVGVALEHVMAQFKPTPQTVKQYNSTMDYMLSPTEGYDSDDDIGIEWPSTPTGRMN